MRNKYPLMKLSREEELFLRHWLFEQFHYESGQGPAKRLQIEHGVIPANLSILIVAAMPDPADQKKMAVGPPPTKPPSWPWNDEQFRARLVEARGALAGPGGTESVSVPRAARK
jgi:hypothetical protein